MRHVRALVLRGLRRCWSTKGTSFWLAVIMCRECATYTRVHLTDPNTQHNFLFDPEVINALSGGLAGVRLGLLS
jgi:hypothetical protein